MANTNQLEKIQILGIAGSLRKNSFNRSALRFAQQSVPSNAILEITELGEIPLYNQDFELQVPPPVLNIKAKIEAADAAPLIAPEYNHSISGVLKNAIDWASRPCGKSSWDSKPVAIIGASSGTSGTARAQAHFRQIIATLNMYPFNRPQVMISNSAEKFDANGNLTDADTKAKIKELTEALIEWAIRLNKNNNKSGNKKV